MENKVKIILRYFLFFFFLFFFIFNWSKISWIFHPTYLFRVFSFYFFEKKQTQNFEVLKGKKQELIEKEDSIEIPKLKIFAPLILVEKKEKVKEGLEKGVILWPESKLPGEKGETIILGHSSPPNWPKIKYDWVFSNLNLLEKGDEIIVYFQKRKFVFSVKEKIFLNKGEKLPQTDPEKSTLILISCWPPGKDLKRIAVLAEKINK